MRPTNPSWTATLLTWVLLTASLQAAPDVSEKVQKLRAGQRMEVVLHSGDKLMGNRGAVFADHFVLEPDNHKQSSRTLNYSEIRTVKTKLTRTTKWIIAGAVYGVVVLIGSRL